MDALPFAGAYLFVYLICPVITALIASSKGRSAVRWFIAGLGLQAAGVVIILFLPHAWESSTYRRSDELKYHRLGEQLKLERDGHDDWGSDQGDGPRE